MRLDTLTPVLDAALISKSWGDGTEFGETVFRTNGWELESVEPTETGEEQRWTLPYSPPTNVPSPVAWVKPTAGPGVILDLIAGVLTDGDADQLQAHLRSRVDLRGEFRLIESDAVWTRWSDGDRTIELATHRSSMLNGRAVVPSVQLGIMPVDLDMGSGA